MDTGRRLPSEPREEGAGETDTKFGNETQHTHPLFQRGGPKGVIEGENMTREQKKNLRAAYRTVSRDPFPSELTVTIGTGKLHFRKRSWKITDEEGKETERGLRYGENPGQPAALFELVASDFEIEGVEFVRPGAGLIGSLSEENMLRFGKHPGKINLTDIDSAVLVLRYLTESPACAIMKHNNPCAVALGGDAASALERAWRADPLAAFGGAVVMNRPVTKEAASFVQNVFVEVVAAPEYEEGAVEILGRRKNLRVIRLARLGDLDEISEVRFLDFTSCVDGSIIVQLSAVNTIREREDFLPARAVKEGREVTPKRAPTAEEYEDMIFGWAVEQGVISNSVLFAKNKATVAIGAGGQDRVGVVKQAISKAFDRLKDRLALDKYGVLFFELELEVKRGVRAESQAREIEEEARGRLGDLPGSVLVSDAFFPRRDGIDLALEVGVTAVCHPGGSIRDWEGIEAVNEADPPAAMVFTGQRAFRH